MTPEIKFFRRRKNRLMRSNRIEEVFVIGQKYREGRRSIEPPCRPGDNDPRHGTSRLWRRVNQLTRGARVQHLTSEFNIHYASISTDPKYIALL